MLTELLVEVFATSIGLLVGMVGMKTGESITLMIILLMLLVGSSTVLL